MKTPKKLLPLSRKFYDGLIARLDSALTANPAFTCLKDEMKLIIDLYLENGTGPAEKAGPVVKLIFDLLRPEIDKAIERSQRSRQSAMRRRQLREQAMQMAVQPVSAVMPQPSETLDDLDRRRSLNRRQRHQSRSRAATCPGVSELASRTSAAL